MGCGLVIVACVAYSAKRSDDGARAAEQLAAIERERSPAHPLSRARYTTIVDGREVSLEVNRIGDDESPAAFSRRAASEWFEHLKANGVK